MNPKELTEKYQWIYNYLRTEVRRSYSYFPGRIEVGFDNNYSIIIKNGLVTSRVLSTNMEVILFKQDGKVVWQISAYNLISLCSESRLTERYPGQIKKYEDELKSTRERLDYIIELLVFEGAGNWTYKSKIGM